MNQAQYSNDRPGFHDPIHIDNLYAFELDGEYNPLHYGDGFSSNEQHWSSCVEPQLAVELGCIDPIPRAPSVAGTLSSDNSHHGQPRSPYPPWNTRSYAFPFGNETENGLSDNRARRESCYPIEPERSGPKTLSTAEAHAGSGFHVGLGLAGGSTNSTVSSYEEFKTATSFNTDVYYSWCATSSNEHLNGRLDLPDITITPPHGHSANGPSPDRSTFMLPLKNIFGHASSMMVEDQRIPTRDDSSVSSWIPASKELARTSSLSSTSATTSSMSKASWSASESLQALRCDQCDLEFHGRYQRGNLTRHKRLRHMHKQMHYTCPDPVCGKTYKRSDALRKHCWKSHRSLALLDQPHTFTAAFDAHSTSDQRLDVTNTDALIAPSIIVAGTLPATEQQDVQPNYACPESGCTHVFERNAELIRHSRTHLSESERPYRCAQCDQSFLYPKDLRRHETTHSETNIGSIHCQVNSCLYGPGGLSFTRRDGLLRHMRRTHPDID
jgi:ssDNA-binding Zn-finger/Zn-ribbon topoisomerase 1